MKELIVIWTIMFNVPTSPTPMFDDVCQCYVPNLTSIYQYETKTETLSKEFQDTVSALAFVKKLKGDDRVRTVIVKETTTFYEWQRPEQIFNWDQFSETLSGYGYLSGDSMLISIDTSIFNHTIKLQNGN